MSSLIVSLLALMSLCNWDRHRSSLPSVDSNVELQVSFAVDGTLYDSDFRLFNSSVKS